MRCLRCGKVVAENCVVCPNCGFQVDGTKSTKTAESLASSECQNESDDDKKSFCAYCGTPLGQTDAFCPKCGNRAHEPLNEHFRQNVPVKERKLNTRYLVIPVILCILCLSGIVLFVTTREPDFRKLYQTYCKTYWADIGSDGSYLYIDTNPQDEDDNGLAYPEAAEAIRNINDALGLPESVINEMGQTTFIDGKQTEIFEKQKVSVSWRYHPNKGLEVTYTKLK